MTLSDFVSYSWRGCSGRVFGVWNQSRLPFDLIGFTSEASLFMDFFLLVPLGAAILFAISSLYFKRGYDAGASTEASFHWANIIGMPIFLPLFFSHASPFEWMDLWKPAITAVLIYIGSWCTFAAINKGDVSLVTPVMSLKVIFVALCAYVIIGTRLGPALWLAAALATAGVFASGFQEMKRSPESTTAIILCVLSAVFFGLSDVLINLWAPSCGGTIFLAAIPQFIGVISLLALRAPFSRPWCIPSVSRSSVVLGSVLLCLQGLAMGLALTFRDPTRANILYSTRGLWSLILIWAVGRWFANNERQTAGSQVMAWRFIGGLLILASVVIASLYRPTT